MRRCFRLNPGRGPPVSAPEEALRHVLFDQDRETPTHDHWAGRERIRYCSSLRKSRCLIDT